MDYKYKDKYKPVELQDLETEDDIHHHNINCPNCGELTPAKNLNINNMFAKCDSCDSVFSFEKEIQKIGQKSFREVVKKPQGLDELYLKDEVEFTLGQPPPVLDIIILCLMPLLVFIFTLIYFKKGETWAFYPAIGTFLLTTYSIVNLVRAKHFKIFVNLTKDKLDIGWRPNNFVKDKSILTREIEQLYVKRMADGTIGLYSILNQVHGQKHELIIGRIKDLAHAKYLEQEIEKYLEIPDQKVTGEI